MARKKSIFILITTFIFMALVSTGCERSYAPIEEGLATPTLEGGGFPDALPSDMEGVFEAGAQTATAQALGADAAAPVAGEATAVPAAGDNTTELAPETTTEAPADTTAGDTIETTIVTATLPVLADPTTEPTKVPSVDVNNIPANYTLKKGEFPYCIARRFNVDPGELLNLNGITTAQAGVYQPGLTLKIPQTGNAFPSDRSRYNHPVTYVVPQTTTVYGVACYFGDVDPAAILNANSISNPDSIAAGTSLQIP